MDNGVIINQMDLEYLKIKKDKFIMVNGKMENIMELAKLFEIIKFILDNLDLDSQMDEEHIIIKIIQHILDNLYLVINKDLENIIYQNLMTILFIKAYLLMI